MKVFHRSLSVEELERYLQQATADRLSSTHQFREDARKQIRLYVAALESALATSEAELGKAKGALLLSISETHTAEAARERAEKLVSVHRERYRATCRLDCPADCLDRFEAEAILVRTEEEKG